MCLKWNHDDFTVLYNKWRIVMQLSKSSWILKVAYMHPMCEGDIPSSMVSLCKLFWRFVFGLLAWPVSYVFCAVVTICTALVVIPVGMLAGFRPLRGTERKSTWFPLAHLFPMTRYETPTVGGIRIIPLPTMLIGWALFCVGWITKVQLSHQSNVLVPTPVEVSAVIAILASCCVLGFGICVVIVAGGYYASYSVRSSDLGKMTVAYIKAKKAKVCPFVEIK